MPAAPQTIPAPELKFHPQFDKTKQQPGDVILQADDAMKLCFFFRLARLAELSSFFAGLPPPGDADIVGGVALIPLPDTSSATLFLVLLAVGSITETGVFTLPRVSRSQPAKLDMETVIEAAVFASKFDLPVIYRILLEGIKPKREPFLEFMIWGMSGIPSKIAEAAEATLEHTITSIPREQSRALRQHAPHTWMKLQDLHLRRATGLKR